MLNRIALLEILLKFIEYLFVPIMRFVSKTNTNILLTIDKIQAQEFVFFTRGDNIANLNKVLLYIQGNEHTKKTKIVTVSPERQDDLIERLKKDIEFLDREYPDIQIEFIEIEGTFAPELIQNLSKEWNIPVNFMFIGSPGDHFPFRVEELGGVRLII